MATENHRVAPHRIAAETFVIQAHHHDRTTPFGLHLNSMVIRGEQPIVVDTGAPLNREQFLEDLFGLVDPVDVRWVFLSHDDIDHAGNVEALMNDCPNATLVTTWLATHRMAAGGFSVPVDRWRWVDDGDVLDVGDRALVVQRPPLYDSPTTRGLLDTSTDVYWAADCFAVPVSQPTVDVADLDPSEWRQGFTEFQQWNSPWVEALDVGWWHRMVSRLEARSLNAIASCHGPVVTASHIPAAIELLRELPALPVVPQPEQRVLEQILAAMSLGSV